MSKKNVEFNVYNKENATERHFSHADSTNIAIITDNQTKKQQKSED